MKKIIGMAVAGLWAFEAMSSGTVTNLVVAQRPGTKLVDITYDVSCSWTNKVTVLLVVSNGTSAVTATSLTGNIGNGVSVGSSKSIVWDMGKDWNGHVATGVVFSVKIAPPAGGDSAADDWEVVDARWIKNTYANGDVTMSDRNTGRMWLYNANPCGLTNWYNAMSYCDNLIYAGYSDWQLPDKDTLVAQSSQKANFPSVQINWYWSSTVFSYNASAAWLVNMSDGSTYVDYKSGGQVSGYVWPMRGQ